MSTEGGRDNMGIDVGKVPDSDTQEDMQGPWKLQAQGYWEPSWSRRRPERSTRLRMDWIKLGKVLLLIGFVIVGTLIAVAVPVFLLRSGNPVMRGMGIAFPVAYLLFMIAVLSGALDFKLKQGG